MSRTLTIEPVTRIEGHARITISLGDDGKVDDAQFHVTQFRGFEKFVEGRPMREMPSLMARICGICPVSHQLASAKACDALLAVEIPPGAVRLRRLLDYAQLVQSHALSLFHLSGPDLFMGMDAEPAKRNVLGLLAARPDLAKAAIYLRQFGQDVIQRLSGKRVHAPWVVPGGVNEPMELEDRKAIQAALPKAMEVAELAVREVKAVLAKFTDEVESFGNFRSMWMGVVGKEGEHEIYDGVLRLCDADGVRVTELADPNRYAELIGEAVEDHSFLKSPYYKPQGYPAGLYRVGPLARLIVSDRMRTPRAQRELDEFRSRNGRAPTSSFHFHWARLIELLQGVELIDRIVASDKIMDTQFRARAQPNRREAVGISEAPRGTLVHHYRIDEQGLMTWANLIIATGHNNLAMNRSVRQVAERFVDGNQLQEGMLNRVEAVIRCYDPCLSCSTHAVGQMPLKIELRGPDGELLDEAVRGA